MAERRLPNVTLDERTYRLQLDFFLHNPYFDTLTVTGDTVLEGNLHVSGDATVDGHLLGESWEDVTTTHTAALHQLILANATGGAFTVTLPAAAGANKYKYRIKKVDSSINAVTVAGNGAETIDGSNTQIISSQYDAIHVYCDGTEWWII
jgi:hypothetical protein